MTRKEAISKLKDLYGDVAIIEPTLFATRIDRKWVLFRARVATHWKDGSRMTCIHADGRK